MLDDAISFPTTADDWRGTIIIGGALDLVGAILFLPLLVVYGYLLRVMRAGATGDTAPSFTDWGELFVDGVKLLALGWPRRSPSSCPSPSSWVSAESSSR